MDMNRSKITSQIVALGEIFDQYGGSRVAREVLAAGGSLAEFHRRMTPRIRSGADPDKAAGLPGLNDREVRDFDICRQIRTMMNVTYARRSQLPDSFDKNQEFARSQLLAERNATCPELEMCGNKLPWAVLTRDFSAGSASESGNLIPTRLGSEYSGDALRNAFALARLGALMPVIKGAGFKVPVITGDLSNVNYLGEVSAAPEGGVTSGLIDFAPKRVGGYLEVSTQALIQGGEPLNQILRRVIFGKVAAAIEDGAINGDGTGNNPVGVRSTANINTVVGGTDGATLSWTHLTDLEYEPANDNVAEVAPGYLINSGTRRFVKRTARGSGLPYMWDGGITPLNDRPTAVSNVLPSNLTKGVSGAVCQSLVYSADWSMLLVPMFGAVDLTVDPYTKAAQGQVRVVINAYIASGVLQPSAFCVMNDAKLS